MSYQEDDSLILKNIFKFYKTQQYDLNYLDRLDAALSSFSLVCICSFLKVLDRVRLIAYQLRTHTVMLPTPAWQMNQLGFAFPVKVLDGLKFQLSLRPVSCSEHAQLRSH